MYPLVEIVDRHFEIESLPESLAKAVCSLSLQTSESVQLLDYCPRPRIPFVLVLGMLIKCYAYIVNF